MDHLVRTPLLLEVANPSGQNLIPGGAAKARTRHLARTPASMPEAGGESNMVRRIVDKLVRNPHKNLSNRRAQRDRMERRGAPAHGHLTAKRTNPNHTNGVAQRPNPQAIEQTKKRISPSKQTNRPAIAVSPKMLARRDIMRGRRI